MLYEPGYSFTPARICVIRPIDSSGDVIRSSVLTNYTNELSVVAELPVHQLIKHFGPLLPAPLISQEDLQAEGILSDQLSVSYLKYNILSNVAGIKIQFVSCLGLHLEFDKRSKTLNIFQFPSFCLLVCLGRRTYSDESEKSYLKRYVYRE